MPWKSSYRASSGCGKIQYPDGTREINELHVPMGQPVKLTLRAKTSYTVFSIPAFACGTTSSPAITTACGSRPPKAGRYRLYCTEYCGNQHASMGGWVNVLDDREYASWAGGGSHGSLAEQGQKTVRAEWLFKLPYSRHAGRCPILRGLYNKPVQLDDGVP